MNLSQLTAQFLALMNRTDLTANNTGLAQTFINQSIIRLQRELRLPFMEKIIEYTVDATYAQNGGFTIPTDFLELIDINVDSDNDGIMDYPLQRVQMKDALVASQVLGVPRTFCRKGGLWILGPAPAIGTPLEIIYYGEFAPLIEPTDTNAIATVGWDAVVYGALSACGDFYNDDRTEAFEQRYVQITQLLQGMADADELTSDGAVRPALLLSNDYTNYDGT